MTPTEQDKELREKLDELLKSPRYGVSLFAGHRDILVEILADFITADRKRVALEARLDELTKAFTAVVGDKNAPSSRYSKVTRLFNKYLHERHKQLKAQQEEV